MKTWAIAVAAAITLVAGAHAAPLDLKQVSADATWVVHLDVDAVRASAVLQRALGQYLESRKDIGGQLDKLRDQIGVDLRKDLHGLTLYGKKIGRSEGVLIVHVEVDQKTLLKLVRFAPDHKMSTYGSYELYSWTDAKGKKEERPVAAAFFKPTIVVFAPTIDELKAALDVLDAKSPALAGKESPLAAAVPVGTVVVARAMGLAEAELPYKSPLVTQSETFSLVLGEHQGDFFGEARLATRSQELAGQVRSIGEGARAMAELQRSQDQAAVKLLKQVKVRAAGKTVELEFRAPAEEVWAWVEGQWKGKPLASEGSLPPGGQKR